MRIDGEWFPCDDGIIRPTMRGEILAANGLWLRSIFLLDPGADRTTFDDGILNQLAIPSVPFHGLVGGLGGVTSAVEVLTRLRLTDDQHRKVFFHADFLATTTPTAIGMPLLGRDITNLFAVIIDRPGDVVCLVSQKHVYRIESLGP